MSPQEEKELQQKVQKLENQMTDLLNATKTVITEVHQLKNMFFQQASRFETLLRYLVDKEVLSLDQFLSALEAYQVFRNELTTLLKEKESIVERVKASQEYNKNNKFKLYADDLELLSQIEKAGGTSHSTAKLIVDSLPMTKQFREKIQKYMLRAVPSVIELDETK